jgi:trigger factor
MTHRIEHKSPSRVVLTASFAAAEVASKREKVVAQWERQAHVDGFRVGKAPRPLIERKFAKEIGEELREELMRDAWQEVRREAKLRPAGPLEVRDAALQEDGGFELAGELDVYPEIELAEVEGFVPPEFSLEPAEGEIDKVVSGLQERQAAWEPVEGEPVTEGMLVEAEIFGEFPDGGGEPFHEERSLFQIGRGEVFPEIEAAVIGHNAGDKVTAERTLGEEAGDERAGKRVAYRAVINSLRRKKLPELDDAFAHSLGAAEGIAKLRETVRERLQWEKRRERREVWRQALVRHLAGGRVVDLPERVVVEETREEVVKFAHAMDRRGVDPEKAKIDWERLEQEMRQRVEERLRSELILDAAAERLDIAVSDAAVDGEVEQQARSLGVPFAELRGNLAKGSGLERVRAILRRDRAVDEILRPYTEGGSGDAGADSR